MYVIILAGMVILSTPAWGCTEQVLVYVLGLGPVRPLAGGRGLVQQVRFMQGFGSRGSPGFAPSRAPKGLGSIDSVHVAPSQCNLG